MSHPSQNVRRLAFCREIGVSWGGEAMKAVWTGAVGTASAVDLVRPDTVTLGWHVILEYNTDNVNEGAATDNAHRPFTMSQLPLPEGWIQEFDPKQKHPFWVSYASLYLIGL